MIAVSPCVISICIKLVPLGKATVAENALPVATTEISSEAAPAASGFSTNYIYWRSDLAVFIKERNPPAFGAAFRAVNESIIFAILVTNFASQASDISPDSDDCLLSSDY